MTNLRQDQEIRASAVRTVILGASNMGVKNRKEFWLAVDSVAEYIRVGAHPEETQAQKLARSNRATREGRSSV